MQFKGLIDKTDRNFSINNHTHYSRPIYNSHIRIKAKIKKMDPCFFCKAVTFRTLTGTPKLNNNMLR